MVKPLSFLPLVPFLYIKPAPLLAQATKSWDQITTGSGKKCVQYADVATIQGFEYLFYNILQVIVFFAGLAFFIMFIVGGFQYILSTGDPKKAAQAGSTLTMAVLGLVGVIASWLILSLIYRITGINVTNFIIPG